MARPSQEASCLLLRASRQQEPRKHSSCALTMCGRCDLKKVLRAASSFAHEVRIRSTDIASPCSGMLTAARHGEWDRRLSAMGSRGLRDQCSQRRKNVWPVPCFVLAASLRPDFGRSRPGQRFEHLTGLHTVMNRTCECSTPPSHFGTQRRCHLTSTVLVQRRSLY